MIFIVNQLIGQNCVRNLEPAWFVPACFVVVLLINEVLSSLAHGLKLAITRVIILFKLHAFCKHCHIARNWNRVSIACNCSGMTALVLLIYLEHVSIANEFSLLLVENKLINALGVSAEKISRVCLASHLHPFNSIATGRNDSRVGYSMILA